jgi:phospholipase/carboxylesterase
LTLKRFTLSFSQGAILSYAIAFHIEKLAVIALSGYLNEELIEENYRNNDFKTNIFASHGVVDQVIPTWKTTPFWTH